MKPPSPRIVLIHALQESQAPAQQAFTEVWPEADISNLVDDSLPADLKDPAQAGRIRERFMALARYAAASGTAQRPTAGILFTCASFGPDIENVKNQLDLPVLKPNEAAFEDALDAGSRIGLMTTFALALPLLRSELEALAARRGQAIEVVPMVAEGALDALRQGDAARHDALAAQAAAHMPPVDALVLGQFSLARAAAAIAPVAGRKILTTPASAVAKLRRLINAR